MVLSQENAAAENGQVYIIEANNKRQKNPGKFFQYALYVKIMETNNRYRISSSMHMLAKPIYPWYQLRKMPLTYNNKTSLRLIIH